jgi:hypothetical protein
VKLWLATLYVLAEGFRDPLVQRALVHWKASSSEISMHWGCIEHMTGQLGEELRSYRYATFPYQSNPKKDLAFTSVNGRHHSLRKRRTMRPELTGLVAAA